MLFNSIEFGVFLPIVFFLYWLLKNNLQMQNGLVLLASYFFYGWWDWRFLALITFSSLVDFYIGQGLAKVQSQGKRRALLLISLSVNLGLLAYFKYYNFFLENFVQAFTFLGYELRADRLNIILPVGISFYTFQTLSYTIDIFKKKIKPTNNILSFFAFVSFFPQLVAGPIERAANLLPQFHRPRIFQYHKAVDGLRQILWGLFKKVVIADNCAEYANLIFDNSTDYSGSTLLLGAIFFSFQIYGDFSGYSDIAVGTSRLLGFNLMQNFAFPYFSRNIEEFWNRWHISLSSWFRDYVYLPLFQNIDDDDVIDRTMKFKYYGMIVTLITFLVSGLWHGANWTFIVWGGLNAVYYLPLFLSENSQLNTPIIAYGKSLPSGSEFFSMLTTFLMTVFAWIFFRAENVNHAFNYILNMLSSSLFSIPQFDGRANALKIVILITLFLYIEWNGREHKYGIEILGSKWKAPFRYLMYYGFILMIWIYSGNQQEFIYFQF
jgi:alginate O-acetyltransferase complex protein AlgI